MNKARSWEFGDLKSSLIKDIYACGLQNQVMREKLLQNDETDRKSAIKYCYYNYFGWISRQCRNVRVIDVDNEDRIDSDNEDNLIFIASIDGVVNKNDNLWYIEIFTNSNTCACFKLDGGV